MSICFRLGTARRYCVAILFYVLNPGAWPGFFKEGGGGGHTVSNIIVMAFSPRNIVGF